jgi:hypothetical protein
MNYMRGIPATFGWTGSAWSNNVTTSRYIPKTATHTLVDGLSVDFNNKTGTSWDNQFVSGDHYTFVYGPTKIKDNLQTMNFKAKDYCVNATARENRAFAVPGSAPYTHHIDEASGPDFRNMDIVDYLTEVYEGSTRYSVYTLPAGNTFTVNTGTDILTVGVNIPTGTPVTITSSGSYPDYQIAAGPPVIFDFFRANIVFYVINVSPTTCKLAWTYADAIGGTAIDFYSVGSGTLTLKQIAPTTGTYYAGVNGVFVFSAADTAKNLLLTYTYTEF